jgi:hypothetical protein
VEILDRYLIALGLEAVSLLIMETLFVVLDTNTFLHYISLDQVGWNEVFPDQDVVLFICPPVIRELNKQKDTPRTSKLRDRATSVYERSMLGWILHIL